MRDDIIELTSNASELLKNTHLHITLSGWPASIALIAICLSGVAIYGINCYTTSNNSWQKKAHDNPLNND